MFEQYFRRPHVLRRMEENVLAEKWGAFVAHLDRRGHSPTTIQSYVQAAEHFGRWLELEAGQRGGPAINREAVEAFLAQHLRSCHCPPPRSRHLETLRAALHQLLNVAASSEEGARTALCPIDQELVAFDDYLTNACGLSPATRCYYVRYMREFMVGRFADANVELSAITLLDVVTFVTKRTAGLTPGSANTVTTAVRSFLRHLRLQGISGAHWSEALPRAACWRLASVPRVLSDDELHAFLASFDRTTATGKRDYAIALCFAGLGLRAGEVAQIALDDIDWRVGILNLGPGKTRRTDRHPLPPRVARAIAEYLRHGRPSTPAREVFVHHRAPRGDALGPSGVRSAVRRGYQRCGLGDCMTGTHVLRHTAASRMLRAGASMKEIADLLRHRTLDTSAIYAKVDVSALSEAALPWPGDRS
jgi:integrase/recombinase XerD